MSTNTQVAITVGHELPITDVVHSPEPDDGNDSGFTILFADAPEEPPEADDPRIKVICLHCLIDQHPEVGRGLDIARRHGEAERDLDTGEWQRTDV